MHLRTVIISCVALATLGCQPQQVRPDQPVVRRTTPLIAKRPGEQEISLGGAPVNSAPAEKSFPGTGQFVKPISPQSPTPRPALADQEVSFNFEATPVPEVVKTILGDLLLETYVIGPGVGGTVTFATAKPIKGDQALAVLEMLLSWSGAALVRKGDAYLVVQTQSAVPGNLTPQMGSLLQSRGYEVRAVPLKYISATQMDELLKPYAKPGSTLKADNARSMIVVGGTRSELENYLKVIESFDVDWMAGMSFGLFTLERVEVKDLMPELEAIFGDGQGGGTGPSASPLAGMVRMLPVERLNAILVITPQQQYLRQVETWIKRLDRGGSDGGARLYVYDVQNVKAIDLADRLNEIFNGQAAAPRQPRTTRGEVAPGLQGGRLSSNASNLLPKEQPTPAPVTPTATSANAAGDGLSLLEGQEVKITAVEENNAILIRSTAAQYEVLKGAIRRLDTEPLQVKIDAKLLEVNLTNNFRFGVQWWLERSVDPNLNAAAGATAVTGLPAGPGSFTVFPNRSRGGANGALNSFGGIAGVLSSGGLGYVFDGPQARALITALQTEGDSKVLSSPTLMVLNNKQAAITVGQSIPISTTSFSPIGGTGSGTVASTQFLDLGITLTVTPRVNPGGLVYMEIEQEQSTPVEGSANEAGNVSVSQKRITTEVAVQSGQTILLGGLIQQNESSGNDGLPYLKNIPGLGRLFGSTRTSLNRTETLVLITPTVVTGGAEAMREVTDEYVRKFKGLEPLIREGVIPPAPIKTEDEEVN